MKKRIIKFIIIMLIYAGIFYLAVSWIAKEWDYNYWWDWQRAIFITALVCYVTCVWDRTKE